MKSILVLGAGRSSTHLIKYLLDNAASNDWKVTIGDMSLQNAQEKLGSASRGSAIAIDLNNEKETARLVSNADIVISLLPAALHPQVAKYCLGEGKHFLTASYVSDDLKSFDSDAKKKGLILLNECGLDPGIDHLSAMKIIDEIRGVGGIVTSFESFTGGLIAPETDPENPWRYKFTWNPRNVVTGGQGTAKYLEDGRYKYIPYQQIFRRLTPVNVPGYGDFEGYANRDSLKYIATYGLEGVTTMVRGTLRNKGFCRAWNVFVQLGCCDDTYEMENVSSMTHAGFLDAFLPGPSTADGVERKLCSHLGLDEKCEEITMLRWSGLFDTTPVGLSSGTPARILEHILNKKWSLSKGDRDLVVMWHRFRYRVGVEGREIQASLVVKGIDDKDTAMAQTVGLPLAIATKLVASGKIRARGVVLPITSEFYDPILAELSAYGITMNEVR